MLMERIPARGGGCVRFPLRRERPPDCCFDCMDVQGFLPHLESPFACLLDVYFTLQQ